MKLWRCTVCGYIHTGEEPPEKCPVCGASKDKFVMVQDTAKAPATPAAEAPLEYGADVVVVGSGAAALAAAITARSRGASVVLLEKADALGGTTARSGGGLWIPGNRHMRDKGLSDERAGCLAYMARYSYPNLYNENARHLGLPDHEYALLATYYDNAAKAVEYLEAQGALDTVMEINWAGKPQVDYMDHLPENGGIRGRTIYPKDPQGRQAMGAELVRQLSAWLQAHGVDMHTGCEVTEILRDGEGRVTGVRALAGGQPRIYYGGKGVIFGTGGFSHNPALMLRFQRGPHYGGCAVPTNTGDFVRMAGALGAQLGNMAGAFRAQSMIEVALQSPGGSSNVFYLPGDSMLLVNKYGRRVLDEKRNYTDRAMLHFVWDPQRAEWRNLLMFMIFDERAATLWQGFPPFPVKGQDLPFFILRADSLEGLSRAIAARLQALAPHTGGFALDARYLQNLRETVDRFNGFAEKGRDEDFNRGEYAYDREWTTFPPTAPTEDWPGDARRNYTLHPLSGEGPYYAIILAAGTLDTSGGPVVNGRAQVLDWAGKPIPGLYGAGNCIASAAANAYWGAGCTIGNAVVFGYLAGMRAAED